MDVPAKSMKTVPLGSIYTKGFLSDNALWFDGTDFQRQLKMPLLHLGKPPPQLVVRKLPVQLMIREREYIDHRPRLFPRVRFFKQFAEKLSIIKRRDTHPYRWMGPACLRGLKILRDDPS
jgi:hypothetical protein